MTQDEIRDQRARILIDIEEHEKYIGKLEVRIKRIGEVLALLAVQLQTRPEDVYSPAAKQVLSDGSGAPPSFDDRDIRDSVDLGKIMQLCDELRRHQSRLRELVQQKAKTS
jgi:hypothetical protein